MKNFAEKVFKEFKSIKKNNNLIKDNYKNLNEKVSLLNLNN